jgi:NADPH:quinone reductase-like Zn-dependent oxidoreductase
LPQKPLQFCGHNRDTRDPIEEFMTMITKEKKPATTGKPVQALSPRKRQKIAATNKLMNAVRIQVFGGPEVLHLQKIPVPEPREGEVLLKIRAASINPVDYKIRLGKYPAVQADKLPYVLGRDAAGDVEICGKGVTAFVKGDPIYAFVGIERGCYAEYVIAKESEASRKPTTLDYAAAAAVPLAGITAWQGLFRHGGLQSGQRVLIHAGSGGVGHFAIQFAKAKGAYVITTVSGENVDFVRRLGADEVIDHKKQQFENKVRDVDMVFDLIGGETEDRSWGVLKKGGILVSTVNVPSQEKAKAHGVHGMRYTAEASGSELGEIAGLIDAGKVKITVSRTFPLKDAVSAVQLVEQGHTRGKVVLTVD